MTLEIKGAPQYFENFRRVSPQILKKVGVLPGASKGFCLSPRCGSGHSPLRGEMPESLRGAGLNPLRHQARQHPHFFKIWSGTPKTVFKFFGVPLTQKSKMRISLRDRSLLQES